MTAATLAQAPDLLDLDTLSQMSVEELSSLYAKATLPKNLSVLDGKPRGRMLAVRYLDRSPLAFLLRGFSASRVFPWAGKTFQAKGEWQGEGINRVRLGAQINLFRFETRRDQSALDGKPCILLDYDLAENPWPIRQIRDELREVAPGLCLGPAMWKQKDGASLALFFAIDTRARG